jgi:lipoprotein-releasing system ATP-binding protein
MEQLIQVIGLNKVFSTPGGSIQVLKDIDLILKKGEMTALMGPSGAGKSTLLHILGTLDRPTSGEVLYSGENVFGLGSDELSGFRNRTVGFVFQFHHLMPEFNTLENTMMPGLINQSHSRKDCGINPGSCQAANSRGSLLHER